MKLAPKLDVLRCRARVDHRADAQDDALVVIETAHQLAEDQVRLVAAIGELDAAHARHPANARDDLCGHIDIAMVEHRHQAGFDHVY